MAEGFKRVAPQVHFPTVDAQILELWDETDAFQTSIDIRPADRSYTFYDGPPFPTGSPHYGNLLAGVIKDIVPRYWTMRGYRVAASLRLGHPRPARSRWKSRRTSGSPGHAPSPTSGSASSTRPAGCGCRPTPRPGRRSPAGSDGGSTSKTTTTPSTPTSWRACGGCSAACGTRGSSTRTSRCCPTRSGPPRRCPTSKPTWTTGTSTIRPSPSGCGRSAPTERSRTVIPSSSGRRRRGRSRPTWPSPSATTSPTSGSMRRSTARPAPSGWPPSSFPSIGQTRRRRSWPRFPDAT